MPNSLRARLKNLVHKGILTQKDLDRIVIVPVDGTGDLISRSEAIRIASGYCHWSNIPAELAKLPPVTPQQEQKTVLYSGDGYADGYMVYDMAECPKCGYEYEEGDKDWGLSFCPNCGQSLNWESEVQNETCD